MVVNELSQINNRFNMFNYFGICSSSIHIEPPKGEPTYAAPFRVLDETVINLDSLKSH